MCERRPGIGNPSPRSRQLGRPRISQGFQSEEGHKMTQSKRSFCFGL